MENKKKRKSRGIKGNSYQIKENSVYVTLTNTRNVMICDIDDWERLKEYTWHERNGYALSSSKGKPERFHRKVKLCPKGYEIDHINRNPLDNRKDNLRIVTRKANSLNKDKYISNKSGRIGVYSYHGRYIAEIYVDGKKMYLGCYGTKEEAIKSREEAEEKYAKPFIEKETLH